MILLGPTASGKTDLLDRLSDGSFEVISADSMQAYRGLDIGTAKPGAADRARLPHHLIDILEPHEQYTCGDFVRRADAAVRDVLARGRRPVISGGTAYYIRSFIYGLPDSPRADAAVRLDLEREERKAGLGALYRELCLIDPDAARAIHANDRYRIIRALEIARVTGEPRSAISVPSRPRPDWSFVLVGLQVDRAELAERIERRVRSMFDRGLVAEVKGLLRRGLGAGDPGMRGIGYREFLQMRSGCLTLAGVRELISANTIRFAKRQMTFFRAMPGVRWIEPSLTEEVRAAIVSGGRTGSAPAT